MEERAFKAQLRQCTVKIGLEKIEMGLYFEIIRRNVIL